MALTACSLTTASTGTAESEINRVVCAAFSYITYSASQDSEESVSQIREHNAALETFGCEAE